MARSSGRRNRRWVYSDATPAQAVFAWPLLAAGLTPLAVLNLLTLAGLAGSATAVVRARAAPHRPAREPRLSPG